MGKGEEVTITCDGKSFTQGPPGDFASDSQFFVFTGVISFLSPNALYKLNLVSRKKGNWKWLWYKVNRPLLSTSTVHAGMPSVVSLVL